MATRDHGERDAAHDSLFNAKPSLTTLHAATWSPDVMRYRAEDLQPALTELLRVVPELRASETYQYE
jgi:alpha-N-acetylglucosaminidase